MMAGVNRYPRRTVLLGGGTVALLATAACNPFSTTTRITQTVTAAPAPVADQMPTLIATTRLHVVRLTNAMAADRSLIARLTPLHADRQSHLTALIQELGRTSPQGAATEKAQPVTDKGVSVPKGGPAALLAGMRADATLAQGVFTDAMVQASRYRAALFASIAAALATHRTVLA